MKALITGACGFIASNLVKSLLNNKDYEIVCIDDLSTGFRNNIPRKCKLIKETLGKSNKWQEKIGKVDVIFHLACIPRVSFSVDKPFESFKSSVLATISILEYAKKYGCRVVFSSSSSIYGKNAALPTPENCPASPESPYALSKWHSEEWCRMYSKLYDVDTVCLRYFNVMGPGSRFGGAYSTVLSAWMYSTLVDKSVPPYIEGDGFQSRDFCFIDNVVQANLLAANHAYKFHGEAFNIAQGEHHTLLDCKNIIEKIYGNEFELDKRSPRIGDIRNTWADISAAKRVLGYAPEVDFENQVRKMVEWYKDFYKIQ